MTSALQFYTNPMSRGRIVRWALEETGIAYETHVLAYGDEMKDPGYLAINPIGKVPSIVYEGEVVTECAAICAYLAAKFPEAKLAPNENEIGSYYRWLFFAAGPIEACTSIATLGVKHDPEFERMLGYGNAELMLSVVTSWLHAHRYATGGRFTAADVYLSSHLGWGMQMNTITPNATIQEYVERTQSRPAHRRANALDDQLLPRSNA